MARITIDDLPAAPELPPEQEEQVQGAGPKSFKPSIESLEGREMYAADLAGALAPGLLAPVKAAAPDPAPAQQHLLVNHTQVERVGDASAPTARQAAHAAPDLALDAALWGASSVTAADAPAVSALPPDRPGEDVHTIDGFTVRERRYEADGRLRYEVEVSDRGGRVVLRGRQTDSGFDVEQDGLGAAEKVVSRYDRVGGKWEGGAWAPDPGQTLRSRTDTLRTGGQVDGVLTADGKWVEKTTGTGGFWEQTDTYARRGGDLLSRDRRGYDGTVFRGLWANGSWLEITSGPEDWRREAFDRPGGKLLTRDRVENSGLTLRGRWDNGRWVETTTGAKDYLSRVDTYDGPGGTLQSREETFAGG